MPEPVNDDAELLCDAHTEAVLIGCCLMDNTQLDDVRGIVRTEDFYDWRSQKLFSLICEMDDQGMVFEIESVRSYMQTKGGMDLACLAHAAYGIEHVIYSGSASEHAEAIARFASRRRLRDLLSKAATDAADRSVPVEIVAAECYDGLKQCITSAWEEPRPLYNSDLPTFPVHALPQWWHDYVVGVANETQTPMDLCAMVSLGCVAASVQRKIRVEVRPGWREPLSLWTIPMMPPGNRKSAVMEHCRKPLDRWEKEERAAYAKQSHARAARKHALEQRQKGALKGLQKGDPDSEAELAVILEELAKLEQERPGRITADDVTPEALADIMQTSSGRAAILSSEGGFFDSLGRYTDVANLDLVLKAHAGDQARVDRRGKPCVIIDRPALTVVLTPQPVVLEGVLREQKDRGLPARCLFALPPSMVGSRDVNPEPVAGGLAQAYHDRLHYLCAIPFHRDEFGQECARYATFSHEAQRAMLQFQEWLEPRIAADGDLAPITEWASKLSGAVARIAAIMHCAELAPYANPWERHVAARHVEDACEIARYLIPHAMEAFRRIGGQVGEPSAVHIARWIRERMLRAFNGRDLVRGPMRYLEEHQRDAYWRGLTELEDHGYIRKNPAPPVSPKGGQKPSVSYTVNPIWAKGGYA